MKKNPWYFVLALFAAGCSEVRASPPTGFQGVVEFDERDLAFEVGGRVRAVNVHRGEALARDAVVATLDDGMVRPVIEARTAEVSAARARVSLLRAGARASDVRSLQAQVSGARATESMVERNLQRSRLLASNGALPTAQVDDLEAQRDRAHAEREAAEERLRTMRAGARSQEVDVAQAQLAAATQALEVEAQRLARYTLRAPLEGDVIDVLVDPGDVVAPGTPVALVADTHHPYVDVFVPQGRVDGVRVGTGASVQVDAVNTPFVGHVEDVGRHTEFTPRYLFSEQERPNLVVRVRVRVDDPNARLHAGVPAFVTFGGTRP